MHEEHLFGRGHKRIRAWVVPEGDDTRPGGSADPDAPAFVLVHGLGLDSHVFEPVVERLRALGRVVVFDLPGFGGVPHPRDPMSIAEFARLVVLALDELGLRRPVLVGHSMGAQVVVEASRGEPDVRGRMVLVAPVVRASQRSIVRVLGAFLASVVHERFGAALASVRGYVVAGPRWSLELLPAMLRYPIEERICGLGGRLVVVRGEHDRLCPAQWAAELVELSGASGGVVTAAGAAHQIVVDNADEVVAAAVSAAGRGPMP